MEVGGDRRSAALHAALLLSPPGCCGQVGVGKRGNVGMVVVIEEGERQIQRETARHRETERDTERQRDRENDKDRKKDR